mgnify:CR=1 FL=1
MNRPSLPARLAVLATALAFALPRRWTAFVMSVVERDPQALAAMLERFPDGSAFAAYQFGNVLHAAAIGALGDRPGEVSLRTAASLAGDGDAIGGAARLALMSDGSHVVSLDAVIETMRLTGRDMQSKYKETALGGLALVYC